MLFSPGFPNWVVVAEDTVAGCDFGEAQCIWHDMNTGLFEVAHDIKAGVFKPQRRDVIICTLGRADVRRGRNLPTVIERFLEVCKRKAPDSRFVLTGPVPTTLDGERTMGKMLGDETLP